MISRVHIVANDACDGCGATERPAACWFRGGGKPSIVLCMGCIELADRLMSELREVPSSMKARQNL